MEWWKYTVPSRTRQDPLAKMGLSISEARHRRSCPSASVPHGGPLSSGSRCGLCGGRSRFAVVAASGSTKDRRVLTRLSSSASRCFTARVTNSSVTCALFFGTQADSPAGKPGSERHSSSSPHTTTGQPRTYTPRPPLSLSLSPSPPIVQHPHGH